jgi:digeranylgeranylglycerophospholipid reductase
MLVRFIAQWPRRCVDTLPSVDVVVVGAGPTGSNSARLLADRGWSVLLLEEHPEVGRPVQCAGLVTPRVFDFTPFPIGDLWENDLRGGIVYSPDGTSVRFETDHVQAQAMDRARFDQKLAESAVDAGAELRTGTKAVAAFRDADGVTVTIQTDGKRQDIRCRLIVGADGIRSRVGDWFGFPDVDERVSAYEAELTGCTIPEGEEHLIPMFAGKAQAPGFFSWIIPVGRGRTRSGLAVATGLSEKAAKRYYERMFEDVASGQYLSGAAESYLIIGAIPLGLRTRLVQDRVMLVGDAAGMAKPTSGGGILMGLIGSEALAGVAHAALEKNLLDEHTLRPYERRVRKRIGRDLRKGGMLRNLFVRFRDDDLDLLARLLTAPKAKVAIETHGDIDYPHKLIAPLIMAQPRLIPFFARILLRRQLS